ncbi:Pex19-domain-containing protein [Thelephora ganbajun]|uniref:Pex19-domain-containing protein n=1 Tax=Thelephora ganbajun TaxID=370292 RepID=A0ACB6ZWD0_THEGA|nr:Pex19-domain-containing protein [Thelephora ganbajun]
MASSSKSNAAHVDEDVDDLDDVLEQFSSPPPKPAAVAEPPKIPKTSVPSSSSQKPSGPSTEAAFSDDFAAEFAKGMESLLKELGDGTFKPEETGELTAEEKEQERLFKDAWNNIMGDTEPSTSTSTSITPASTAKSSQKGPKGSFQDRVRQTMDKMKEGQSSLKSGDGGGDLDPAALLSSLNNMESDGEADEGLQELLETMMSQLMSKEVLYEPLKEMHEKFPGYLIENKDKLPQQDKDRYGKQQKTVSQIIAIFEAKDYSEESPEVGLKVMSLMNEMQEHGAPPAEIMGELPPGVTVGPDGLPQLPRDCRIM